MTQSEEMGIGVNVPSSAMQPYITVPDPTPGVVRTSESVAEASLNTREPPVSAYPTAKDFEAVAGQLARSIVTVIFVSVATKVPASMSACAFPFEDAQIVAIEKLDPLNATEGKHCKAFASNQTPCRRSAGVGSPPHPTRTSPKSSASVFDMAGSLS